LFESCVSSHPTRFKEALIDCELYGVPSQLCDAG
jgi:hypothetical protein